MAAGIILLYGINELFFFSTILSLLSISQQRVFCFWNVYYAVNLLLDRYNLGERKE